jgi:hypothetical protein
MMTRLSTSSWTVVACILSAATGSVAFRPLHFTAAPLRQATHIASSAPKNLNEFDFLLHENEYSESSSSQIQIVSRRRIHLNDNRGTILASSTALASPTVEEESLDVDADAEVTSSAVDTSAFELDPYADVALETSPQMQRLQQSTEQQSTTQKIEAKLKTMDLQDVISTLIIPSIVAFAGIRWGYNKVTAKLVAKADSLLDSFAKDLTYHDGDFEEMKLSASDYSKKLAWLGPGKTEKMLKRYLALYSKKKTVSPQSIRYVGREMLGVVKFYQKTSLPRHSFVL